MKGLGFLTGVLVLTLISSTSGAAVERARELGVPLKGQPGPFNAITDVPGVLVGQKTILADTAQGAVQRPIRTGVTIVSPGSPSDPTGPAAAFFSFNGTGEMTGAQLINESGAFFGPLALTGTASVGVVRDSLHGWAEKNAPAAAFSRSLPVVGETYDGALNTGTVSTNDVWQAITQLASGPVAEGGVGGGTGMIAFDYKGGIGTSSRQVKIGNRIYTVGVLVQSNFGVRKQLVMGGIPVGDVFENVLPPIKTSVPKGVQTGSIVVIIATDAPLESRQLARLAKRGVLGLARTGSIGENLSGDLFLAFSNVNRVDLMSGAIVNHQNLPDASLNPVFEATVQATEEAILNGLVAGQKMTGLRGTVFGIPHQPLKDLMTRATGWKNNQIK